VRRTDPAEFRYRRQSSACLCRFSFPNDSKSSASYGLSEIAIEQALKTLDAFASVGERPAGRWALRITAKVPDYAAEAARAPKKATGETDRSQVDWNCRIAALAAGASIEDVVKTLKQHSEKARERGRSGEWYCELTARRAADRLLQNAALSLGKHPLSHIR
jgi:hypothetical protein